MIFEKVEELCALIEDTKQYTDYLEAEVELENDGKGMDLIKDFNDLQQEYIKIYNETKKEDIDALERILESRHAELLTYPTTGAYIRTKQALDELLEEINRNMLTSLNLIPASDGCDFCSDASCESGCCDHGGCEGDCDCEDDCGCEDEDLVEDECCCSDDCEGCH